MKIHPLKSNNENESAEELMARIDKIQWKIDLKNNIKKYAGYYFAKELITNTVKAFKYAWFGWKTVEWDSSAFLEMMKFKIQQMYEYHDKHGVTDREYLEKTVLHDMHTAMAMIDDVLNRDHQFFIENEFIEKYGGLPVVAKDNMFGDDVDEWTEDEKKTGREWKIEYSFDAIPEENREAAKQYWHSKEYFERMTYLENKDKEILFAFLAQHYDDWWD